MSSVASDLLSALVDALAAITGQTAADLDEELRHADQSDAASRDDIQALVNRVCTRLGIAPAVDKDTGSRLREALRARERTASTITTQQLEALDRLLRHTPEHVPTLDRPPVVIPLLPPHQTRMWRTLLQLESDGMPWVLVGGQMVLLHCLENAASQPRPTDDGDIIVGVWTRRDSLGRTTRLLTGLGFVEDATSDGLGYRYRREEQVVIDVMIPEGTERQLDYPRSATGRPGFAAPGGNQALARAERVPVVVDGEQGWIRRPTLLGAIVAKANAYVADNRDRSRHAGDIVTMAQLGLQDPRTVLADAGPHDRRAVRRFLRDLAPDHAYFRTADDPVGAHALLSRLAR